MTKGLDIGAILTLDELKMIRQQRPDIEMVNPYLDPYNPKGCTPQYLKDIYAAGFELGLFFYETTGGSGQGDSYFTFAQGAQDATLAEGILAEFRAEKLIPDKVRVCYADDVRLIEVSKFDEYANGIESVATPFQIPKIYGFNDLMHYAQEKVNGQPRYPNMGPGGVLTYGDPQGLVLDGWQSEQVTVGGITIDLSEMYIPGYKPQGGTVSAPQFAGQSIVDVNIGVGEVAILSATYVYPAGPRTIQWKVIGRGFDSMRGPQVLTLYPPADPDNDPTLEASARPCIFVVSVHP